MGCGRSADVAPSHLASTPYCRSHHVSSRCSSPSRLQSSGYTLSNASKASHTTRPDTSADLLRSVIPRATASADILRSIIPGATLAGDLLTAMRAQSKSSGGERFQALDALRGFAALCVLYEHMCGIMYGWGRAKGQYLAVDFLSVLSGFLLTDRYMPPKKPHVTSLHVIGYRMARLLPLHWLTVWMMWYCRWYVVKAPNCEPAVERSSRIQELFFLHSLGLPYPYCSNNHPSWSLSCEFWINVAFAFVIRLDIPKLLLLGVAILGEYALYIIHGNLDERRSSGLVRCLSSFLLGAFGHSLYKDGLPSDWARIIFTTYPTVAEVTSCLLVYLIVWTRPEPHSKIDFCGPPAFMVTVVCFAFEAGCLSKALRVGEFLGTISYSVYLVHWSILGWLMTHNFFLGVQSDHYMAFARLCAIVLPFSTVTYFLWEKPTHHAFRKLTDSVLASTACHDVSVSSMAQNVQV